MAAKTSKVRKASTIKFKFNVTRYLEPYWPAILLAALSLSPLLQSGFFGDDALQSLTHGAMLEAGRNPFEQYLSNLKYMAPYRLALIQLYHWTFVIFSNLLFYKIYVLGLVLANLVGLSTLVRSITRSHTLTYFSFIIPLLLFQFRSYGDPILVFHGLVPLNLLALLLSLIALKHFLEQGRKIFLSGSLGLYFLSAASYEFAYPLCLLHLIIIGLYSSTGDIKGKLKQWLPYVGVPLFLGVSALLLRTILAASDLVPIYKATYTPHLAIKPFVATFTRQATAAFPLIYRWFDPHHLFTNAFFIEPQRNFIVLIILALGYSSLVTSLLGQAQATPVAASQKRTQKKESLALVALGLVLWLIPAATVALSPSYQKEIMWGCGYTPTYFGYFGLALVCIALLSAFPLKRLNRPLRLALGGVAGLIGAFHYNYNLIAVENLNSFWHYPRTVIESSLRNGLLKEVPQGSFIFIQNNFPWDITTLIRDRAHLRLNQETYTGGQTRYFMSPFDGTRWKELSPNTTTEIISKKGHPALASGFLKAQLDSLLFHFSTGSNNVFYLDYFADAPNNGYAILGKLTDLLSSNTHMSGAAGETLQVFIQHPLVPSNYRNTLITGDYLDRKTLKKAGFFRFNENELKGNSSGLGWKQFELRSDADRLIDLKSISVSTVAKYTSPSSFWKLKDESRFRLHDSSNKLLHIGFDTQFQGTGLTLPTIKWPATFTVEILARPTPQLHQVPFAHIFGNHPGTHGFEGFVIQQDNHEQNQYLISFGNGKEWISGGRFTANPVQTTYLALVKSPKNLTLFRNGEVMQTLSLEYKDSDLPLQVGNFQSLDRPFKGTVDEIQITGSALSDQAIKTNWRTIRALGPSGK